MEKEEYAIVLDYLPYGYPLEKKMMPIAQAIGKKNFTLLQLVPRRGISFELKEEAYIGDGKRDKVLYILGRLPREKLTETAKIQLSEFIEKSVEEDEKRFVDFFNKAQAMNTRLHQFELLPGFGKKHTKAILEERNKKPFDVIAGFVLIYFHSIYPSALSSSAKRIAPPAAPLMMLCERATNL